MEARYVKSVYTIEELPRSPLVEIAVAGKSNVGKSSLINRLTNRRQLAKISRTPGKTRCLNFFLIEPEKSRGFHLVDLPGYGYARVSKSMRDDWAKLLNSYLADPQRPAGMIALFDARREAVDEDIDWLLWLAVWGRPYVVVLTKCDKLSRTEQAISLASWRRAMGENILRMPGGDPIFFSTVTGEGKDRLWQWIDDVRQAKRVVTGR